MSEPTMVPPLDGISMPDHSLAATISRRASGRQVVDPWGLDEDLVSLVGRVPTALRTEHAGRIPDGPAVVVHRDRAPWVPGAAVRGAIAHAVRRPVRFLGVPDLAPIVALAHRLGGIGRAPADLRGLLRAQNLVSISARPRAELGGLATVPRWAAEAAAVTGAPLVPVEVTGPSWPDPRPRLVVGAPIPTRRRSSTPAVDDLLEQLAGALERLEDPQSSP